jgi:hypothetical protein
MLPRSLALFLIATTGLADTNWPQFRGEGGLGIGSGKPPVEFSAEKNIRWKIEMRWVNMVLYSATLFHFTRAGSTFGFWHRARHGMNWKFGCHNLS